MALVRNGLSMKMKGRAGSFSFYSSKGRQVVRVAQNSTNYGESARRSEAQQVRRVKWANLVNAYKLMGQTLHGAFETKRSNETDYNAFMRKNLPNATVALTKDQAAMGMCAWQSFQVSEGSLPTLSVSVQSVGSASMFVCNLRTAADKSWDSETIANFSQSLINNNTYLKEGMQISLLVVNVTADATGPKSLFVRYELTLSLSDERTVSDVLPMITVTGTASGLLSFPDMDTDAYVAMVLSDSTSGQLKVSTATFSSGDDSVEGTYSDDAQVAKAMESYGVDASRFLDSGDYKA